MSGELIRLAKTRVANQNMYSLLPAFISTVFAGFSLYVLTKERMTRVWAPFIAMCVATCAWQGTWAILFQTTSVGVAVALAKVGYLFILFLPTAFYHFVTEVVSSRREKTLLRTSYGLCVVLAILVLAGNEVISGVTLHSFGYYPRAGRLHPVHVVQTLVLAGRSAWLLFKAKRHAGESGFRDLINPCLISLGVYTLAGTDYAVNYGYDFYPLGVIFIAICPAIFAVAIEERDRSHPLSRPGM